MLNKTISVIIGIWWLALSSQGFAAQEEHSRCMAASGGVTAAMLDCIGVALDSAETELTSVEDRSVQSGNAELTAKLGAAQADWLAYRDSTCAAEAAAAGSGSFSNVALLDCRLRITWERLQWLESLLANPDNFEE